MKPGHTFTIEPMINEGKCAALILLRNLLLEVAPVCVWLLRLVIDAGMWKDITWPDNWTAATVVRHTHFCIGDSPLLYHLLMCFLYWQAFNIRGIVTDIACKTLNLLKQEKCVGTVFLFPWMFLTPSFWKWFEKDSLLFTNFFGEWPCCDLASNPLLCDFLQDGKRSAQFEQTLLVTDTGYEILTLRPDEGGKPHFMTQGIWVSFSLFLLLWTLWTANWLKVMYVYMCIYIWI